MASRIQHLNWHGNYALCSLLFVLVIYGRFVCSTELCVVAGGVAAGGWPRCAGRATAESLAQPAFAGLAGVDARGVDRFAGGDAIGAPG